VTITNNPSDEEFWQFEARIVVRANIGIPYGRRPQDFNVIGTRDDCEALRSTAKVPTEPCKGRPRRPHECTPASQRSEDRGRLSRLPSPWLFTTEGLRTI